MSSSLVLRALAVAAAAGAAFFLLSSRAADAACEDAGQRVFAASGGFQPLAELDPAIEDLRERCDGAAGLLTAAETIRQASVRRPSLAPAAVGLAREGTRLEPDNYIAWVTLAATLARTDPAAAREPFDRARHLNPRLAVPASLRRPGPPPERR